MEGSVFKKIDKKYVIYKENLGKGAYGVVMKAGYIDKPKPELACKIIVKESIQTKIKQSNVTDKSKLKTYIIQRLKDQIRIWKNISHPNIVQFVDYSETANNIYLFMQYCQGSNIQKLVQTNGPLPQKNALIIIKDLVDATAFLHANEIIHRDIKPDNVLIKNGRGKLADFGFAKFKNNIDTIDTGTKIGTTTYMAPQLLYYDDKPRYSAKCDVWSIGVLMYILLFGIYPWEHFSDTLKFRIELLQPLKFPPKIPISQQLKTIIQGALKYEENERVDIKQLQSQLAEIMGIKQGSSSMEIQ